MQAAQASYSGEAQHHKQGRCATISIPILDRLRLHSVVSYRIVCIGLCDGCKQPRPPIVVMHNTTGKGRAIPILDRPSLHNTASYT